MSVLGKWNRALLCGLSALVAVRSFGGPVVVLKGPNAAPYQEALRGFRQVHPGGSEIDQSKRQRFLAQLQIDPPSLVVAIGRSAAEFAHERCGTIPLLFVMVPDPAESKLTGTNIAGISMDIPGDVQLACFKQLLPHPEKSVAIVYSPARSGSLVRDAQAEAGKLGLSLELIRVESPEQVRLRITMFKPVIGAVWVMPDESFATGERENKWFTFLVDETISGHLPLLITMNAGSPFVEDGALAALVSDSLDMGRQCGELVKRIESGKTKIESLGLQPPELAHWKVNPATARRIGLKLPATVMKPVKIHPER